MALRRAVRKVATELRTGQSAIDIAIQEGRLWGPTSAPRSTAWKKEQAVIREGVPVRTVEYLDIAYEHVRRLSARSGGASLSVLVGRRARAIQVKESDRLGEASEAMGTALASLDQILAEDPDA